MNGFLHKKDWSIELLFLTAFLSAIIGIVGAYWDIGWHFDFGRDTFWSPPHLFIYGSITLTSLFLILNLALALKRGTAHKDKHLFHLLLFAAAAILFTYMSAPIDDLWHRLYGIDVEIISLPHLMLLFGAILGSAATISLLNYHIEHNRKKFLLEKVLLPFLMASILVASILIFAESEFSTLPLNHPVQSRQPWVYPVYSFGFAVAIIFSSKYVSSLKWSATLTIMFFLALRTLPIVYNSWWGMDSIPVFPPYWLMFLLLSVFADLFINRRS